MNAPRGELRGISLCHPERSLATVRWRDEVEGSKTDSSTPSPQQVGAQSLRMTMLMKRASRNGTRKRLKDSGKT